VTTYYVDYTGGSDSYDGTHETFTSGDDGPWKTINKVNNSTFVAGDNILFKRGEVWRSELLHLTDDGSSGSPITVDAYGIGARPIISWSIDLSSAGDWIGRVKAIPMYGRLALPIQVKLVGSCTTEIL